MELSWENNQRPLQLTISTKKFHNRCLTGPPKMFDVLPIEGTVNVEWVDCKCMEFVTGSWFTVK